jgi:hypothetical protein
VRGQLGNSVDGGPSRTEGPDSVPMRPGIFLGKSAAWISSRTARGLQLMGSSAEQCRESSLGKWMEKLFPPGVITVLVGCTNRAECRGRGTKRNKEAKGCTPPREGGSPRLSKASAIPLSLIRKPQVVRSIRNAGSSLSSTYTSTFDMDDRLSRWREIQSRIAHCGECLREVA